MRYKITIEEIKPPMPNGYESYKTLYSQLFEEIDIQGIVVFLNQITCSSTVAAMEESKNQ